VVIVYSLELVSLREFRAIAAVRRTEFIWALTAFAGVLLLGTLKGILVAVVTSLVALARQALHPAIYEVVCKPGADVLRRPRSRTRESDAGGERGRWHSGRRGH
jgi:sulfate permease, SulP family